MKKETEPMPKPQTQSHVAIIGAGIAGLATAYYLQTRARAANLSLSYTLVEKTPQFGGKIITNTTGGFLIEGGPDSFISQKPWARQLCLELGLKDRLIGTNDAKRKTFIVHKGRLKALPDGVMLIIPTRFVPFALSTLISPLGKLRMAMDLFIPAKKGDADESLSSFIRRRLGKEALDRIAEPLMAGIYVADPENLSLQSTFPRFIAMEKKYGSLTRGMLSQIKARAAQHKAGTLPAPLPLFMTLRGGLTELVNTLVGRLEGELLTGVGLDRLEPPTQGQDGYQLHLSNGETRTADAVVLATPAPGTANLLDPLVPDVAHQLRQIRYLSTATVSLAFKRSDISHPLNGFGFVVPKSEPCRLMACTWVSTKFDHRAPEDHVLLRVFVGGYKHQALVDLSDEELLTLVRAELKAIMGITAEPTRKEIYRWPHGNAQYDVGHLDRVTQIETQVAQALPGLYLTGSSFRGVGLPDCIHQAEQTVEQITQGMSSVS
jgi:oxygen-dependent protoporphyrinogen oxidase